MVTGDAIFLGMLVFSAIGLTIASFMLRSALFYLMAGFMWPAVGIWIYTLVPSPVGNAALWHWTVLLAGLMSLIVFGKFLHDLMTNRQDGEEKVRLAYRRRLDEITTYDEDDDRPRATARVNGLPTMHPDALTRPSRLRWLETLRKERRKGL